MEYVIETNPGEGATGESVHQRRERGVTARAVLLGIALIPLLVSWAEYVEIKAQGPDMVSTSIIVCVFFAFLVLLALNSLVRRIFPRAALSARELLVIYVLGGVGVSPCGIGMLQWLVPTLPVRARDPKLADTNGLLPDWTRVTDPEAARAFYEGRAAFWDHAAAWLVPMLAWTAFLLALFGGMYCLATLLRRPWVEQERLLFPLVQLPLEMAQGTTAAGLLRDPRLWLGAGVALLLQSLAAAHYTFAPTLPFVPIKPNDLPNVTDFFAAQGRPWTAVGNLQFSLYPFVIGIAFLLSLETSFSCWAFFLLAKAFAVLLYATGFGDADGANLWSKSAPRLGDQAIGGFLGLAVMSLWLARRHLAETLRAALGEGSADDGGEPLSYRAAWAGLALATVTLVGFGVAVGLTITASLLFFGVFFCVVIAFSRIRAEAGIPWGYGPPMNVNGLVVEALGTATYSRQALGGFSTLLWMDHDYRSTQMPYQMEAMKAGNSAGLEARRLTMALLAALLVGIAAAWLSQLVIYYHYGGDNGLTRTGYGRRWPTLLQNWLSSPRPPDGERLLWVGVGGGMTLLLAALRTGFTWWPLHPIGYVVANTWTMQWIWLPMLIGWFCKAVALRYGGMGLYRSLLPFFYGLILGDYAISGLLALFYTASGLPGYRTFPI